MNKFIEIESRHGRLFYINIAQIVCIENFKTYRIIYLTDNDNIETFESYEDIKAKIDKNTEETRHGEWKKHFSYGCWHYDCPFCDEGFAVTEEFETNQLPRHCSNCGAKINGERKIENDS